MAGDFDGDSDVDLATGNLGPNSWTSGSVTVLRNSGVGTFTSVWSQTLNTNVRGLAAGDSDKDGDLDLVAVGNTYGYGGYVENPLIAVFAGNGDGTFAAGAIYSDITPSQVAAGDFNGDGNLDLAVANGFLTDGYYYLYRKTTIWLGNGKVAPWCSSTPRTGRRGRHRLARPRLLAATNQKIRILPPAATKTPDQVEAGTKVGRSGPTRPLVKERLGNPYSFDRFRTLEAIPGELEN